MSHWHVNSQVAFTAPDGGPVTIVDTFATPDLVPPDTTDRLSDPSDAAMRDVMLLLLPQGMAWRSPDGAAFAGADTSVLGRFVKALSAPFADLYRSAYRLTLESTASTIGVSLEDWERDWALPDPCIGGEPSVASRLRHLRAKVRSRGTITPADFVRLADFLGYRVAIEEPDFFECGLSVCDGADEPTAALLEYQWVVHVFDVPFEWFETGVSQTGEHLLDFETPAALTCVFDRVKPAWTRAYYDYSDAANAPSWPDVWPQFWE